MHATDLKIGRNHFQVGVDAAKVMLLQLHADMLGDEVNSNHVVAPRVMGWSARGQDIYNKGRGLVWHRSLMLLTTEMDHRQLLWSQTAKALAS